jgi:transporter family-2 protein
VSLEPQTPVRSTRIATIPLVLLAFVCGSGVAFQSRINGELGQRLHDGFAAADVSFASGLILVLIVLAFSRHGRRGFRQVASAVRSREVPFWYVLGGSAGAFLVLGQGIAAGVLGAALFTVGVVAGQTVGGLVVDRRGLGTMLPKPLTIPRVVGSAIALIAVGVAVSTQLTGNEPFWLLLLPLAAGLGQSWQQAVNGQVRAIAESALTSTLINFIVGTIVLTIALSVDVALAGWPSRFPTEPWVYLGGPVGVCFIAISAMIVRSLGVLLLSLGTIAGQLVTSLLIELVAPVAGHPVTLTTAVGTSLTLVALVIAEIPRRRAKASK